ncbi:hypothetical protein MJO28_013523 [Puccinia striiformis f. sp. tritici]|uniref:Uncharacterized protein n=3 Tax=Puccinia striiformis TaxID=27350 RepID=A0A0L0V5D2_9BASI|nr:hypothetical protein Pst134EA_025974 [Puccinia striiformis f. sp. tritici]KNE94495.1 hypothetical protein PSTG_12141 [Puccinia striiformis f. sp. tritici PST-78]POW03340.1 hypothetical protein PSTT_11178 [Puccinia striiformis]KAH9444195.1 hypothetical protein Pst134EB_026574 [Puccinia striiformis f. sp. tritici]KAH9452038.1 hypothetical protein Pst134EA_025974 [Puccinia striiformis f. sp. tritici]KAI7939871.1 hypothetical protein MJO28_013523 [Puccinia striiformis f. sp. tritici]
MPIIGELVYPNIYVTIHLRPGFRPVRFHWTIFIPQPTDGSQRTSTIGVKYHVIDLVREPYWAYEVDWNFNLGECLSVGAAVVIGQLKRPWGTGEIHELLSRQVPLNSISERDEGREPRFSCRTWVKEAIRMLDWHGVLQCDDVDELEYEIKAFGERVVTFAEHGVFRGAEVYYSQFSR